MLGKKSKQAVPARMRVPMQGTGAEQLAVVMKVLYRGLERGVALFSSGLRATGDRRTLMDGAKPYNIPKREVWEALMNPLIS